jgi:hypothetical protein
MSTLSVDAITGQTTTGVINIKNHVINQVRAVATIISSTQTITTDSYADVNNSSYSYTPVSADSRIVLHYYGHCRNLGAASQDVFAGLRPYFNGAAGNAFIVQGDNLGKLGDSIYFPFFYTITQQIAAADHTTSAIAMKLQGRAGSNGQNLQFTNGQSSVFLDIWEIGQ